MANVLTSVEREAMELCICCDALSKLVSTNLLQLTPVEDRPDEMEVRFHSAIHQNLFLMQLLDFINEGGLSSPLGDKASCLGVLKRAAFKRRLAPGAACESFSRSVDHLSHWLGGAIAPKFWLPSIGLDARLSLTRHQLLWISGNAAGHNPSRMAAAAKQIHTLLASQGHPAPIEQMPFLLRDLRSQLNDSVFIYYATQLAELLNDIRWNLQSYLATTYVQSCRTDDSHPQGYRFLAPQGIRAGSAAHEWFHRLMSQVRTGPTVPPFRASRFLQVMHSLEW